MKSLKGKVPHHVAIIMDGNGRWAKERGLPRTLGHRKGVQRVKEIIRAAGEFGIKVITLFAFSTENWSRPPAEIRVLMRFLDTFLDREVGELAKNNVRLLVIGAEQPLPDEILKKLKKAQDQTAGNTGLTLVLALNYGSRQEIVDAAARFARMVARGDSSPEELDIRLFSELLSTAGIPDPDLLIRTSGEMRISNFLLWQLSYAELYFPKKYWPDFGRSDLLSAIRVYQRRERRFGGVDAAH
jgi:undecaprenyl diphosphate synthase